jgi:PAS domain S-box-containing protein
MISLPLRTPYTLELHLLSPGDCSLTLQDASEHELEQLREMFQQAPGAMAVLRGPKHVFELVNPAYLQLIGHRDVLGKPIGDALPELREQGFVELLDRVYATREAHVGKQATVSLERVPGATLEHRVLDFIYQPLKNAAGAVTGIFVAATDVTDRTRAEQALAQQKRLYEAILTNTPDLAYVWDLNHRFIYANEGLLKMWGKSAEDAIGKNCLELGYEPWHAAMHDREIEQVIATKKPVRGEVPFTGAFGRRIYDYLLVPVFGANGEVEAIAGTTRDVTDRKVTEEALRQSETRFRQLIEASPAGVAISETDGKIVLANDALLEIMGYTRADLEKGAVDWQRSTPPEYLQRDHQHMQALREGGSPAAFEKEFIRPDGSRVPVLIVARFIPGEGNRMVAFAMDITQRKQAEESLRKTEQRLSRIFETNLLGLLYFDFNGGVLDANEEFLRIVGYSREDLREGTVDWSRITPTEFKNQDARAVADLRRTGAHAPIEKQYIRKDSSRVWVLVGSALVDREMGVGFVLDLSGVKEAEDALREADRRKDEFIATLSHELRNPLAPIRNALELVKRSPISDPQLRTASEIIDRQVQHMVRLVDDLLDVSRITLGHVNLRQEAVSLKHVLSDAIEAARPAMQAAEHHFTAHLPEKDVHVMGDATRLSQVFQNVLNNAAKYTPNKGRIELELQSQGRAACVHIRDSGIGIPLDMQLRVFDLFTRVHPSESIKTSGLGIGLALAKKLVELQGGQIEVRSEGLGKGSEFTITLPIIQTPSLMATAQEGATIGNELQKRRVLVVDDNRDAAESLGMLLEVMGCEVAVGFDGPTALELAKTFQPDLVLLDIGMPGMDGYAVAKQLRASARGNQMLLVALTGWGQKEDKQIAILAGFDKHFTKPIDPNALATLVR